MTSDSSVLVHATVLAAAGFGIGALGSVPITGPIALMVLSRASECRYRAALGVGLGAALAESLYAALAYFGFGVLGARAPAFMPVARALAAVMLVIVGLVFLLRRAPDPSRAKAPRLEAKLEGLPLGVSVSALNPTLLGTWLTVVGILHAYGLADVAGPFALVFGAAAGLGIACWEACFVGLLRRSESRVSRHTLAKVVRGTGALVVVLGVHAGFVVLRSW